MLSELTPIDYTILIILGISILLGLLRGFIREIISLITWIAAFFVASYFCSSLADSFSNSQHVKTAVSAAPHHASMLAIGISYLALFIGTLLVGSIINYLISSVFETGGISIFNRILGGIFGLLRGFIIILVFVFLIQLTPLGSQDLWMQSPFIKIFQPSIKKLGEIIEPGLESIKTKANERLQKLKNQAPSKNEMKNTNNTNNTNSEEKNADEKQGANVQDYLENVKKVFQSMTTDKDKNN